MQPKIVLAIAFAVQAGLAGALLLTTGAPGPEIVAQPLLEFPSTDVNKVVISDGTSATTLVKAGDRWQLVSLGDLPANRGRLTTLLQTLEGLRTRWPVVSSDSGRERFEVTEEKHQRHLQLFTGEDLRGDYYFGTAPGFKQTHARRADEDEVYALAFNNFDLPADSNDWLDKGLLKVDQLNAIEGGDYALMRTDDLWSLAGDDGAAPAALDATKAAALVSALQNLQVLRLADGPAPAGEARSLTVSDGNTRWTYEFTKADGQQYVRRSDLPQTFTLSSLDYDRTAAIDRSDLLAAQEQTEVQSPEQSQE